MPQRSPLAAARRACRRTGSRRAARSNAARRRRTTRRAASTPRRRSAGSAGRSSLYGVGRRAVEDEVGAVVDERRADPPRRAPASRTANALTSSAVDRSSSAPSTSLYAAQLMIASGRARSTSRSRPHGRLVMSSSRRVNGDDVMRAARTRATIAAAELPAAPGHRDAHRRRPSALRRTPASARRRTRLPSARRPRWRCSCP